MACPFNVSIVSPTQRPAAPECVLAEIGHDLAVDGGVPAIRLPLVPLPGMPIMERWTARTRVLQGEEQGIAYRAADNVLVGCMRVPVAGDFAGVAYHAYRQLLAFLAKSPTPQLLRIWNYFPAIHAATADGSRYQAFCVGRHRALSESGGLDQNRMPAATVIGTQAGDLLIYFLASAQPGAQMENPRQLSAYRYPPEYGPASPSFSRATFKDWGDETHLYVSGTASIVGHRSRHTGDACRQLDEALANLRALLAEAGRVQPRAPREIDEAVYLRVYLRHASDLDEVRARLEAVISARIPVVYLRGDICRLELLVEIEALCVRPIPQG